MRLLAACTGRIPLRTGPTLAAIDLGSNSFRLELGRVERGRVRVIDSQRIAVRLGAGLSPDKRLDEDSQRRGLEAVRRFARHLEGFPGAHVRAVGTNTLRVARNAREFIAAAERALGHPIEVIAGREEARMIFTGVAYAEANESASGDAPADARDAPAAASDAGAAERRLVIDIGGGSTEISVGTGDAPDIMESLYIGSINVTLAHFPGGYLDGYTFRQAELAARREIEVVAHAVEKSGWTAAIASSGTARTIARLLAENHGGDGSITAAGLRWLKRRLLAAGTIERIVFTGLKPERALNLPGGLAIMTAVFDELGIERMRVSPNALRLGVLVDLMHRLDPRAAPHDLREDTVTRFEARYQCDRAQSTRVAALALALADGVFAGAAGRQAPVRREIGWAARLAEIGFSIAHNGYHKHSAYVIANADMPGFSRDEQKRLAFLILGHAGKLPKLARESATRELWLAVACLRVAALVHRGRAEARLPDAALTLEDGRLALRVAEDWLEANPLAAYSLARETQAWEALGAERPFRFALADAAPALA